MFFIGRKTLASIMWKWLRYFKHVWIAAIFVAATLSLYSKSFAQVTNGDFSAGGAGWSIVSGSGGTVTYPGNARVVGGDSGGGASYTSAAQTINPTDPGYLNFTLVSYSSTDSANWDRPVVSLSGTLFGISAAGTLVANGAGINNGSQASGTNVTVRTFRPAGSSSIQFGVYSVDSIFGPGIATYDNIAFQELTQSPSAQSTPANTNLVLTGANDLQVATNSGAASMTVALSVSNGTITLGSIAGLTINSGGNGTSAINFTGTPAQINAAMATITYAPNSGYSGVDNLEFTATEGANSDTDTIPITVTASFTYDIDKVANPTIVTAAGQTINYTITVENTGTGNITGVSLSDALVQDGTSTNLALVGPTGDGGSSGVLDVGETWTYTASHGVTQTQIDNGNDLVNTVSITSNEAAADSASDTTTITQTPSLTLTKFAYEGGVPPALGGTGTLAAPNRPVNTVLTYVYTVTNNGNITIDDVSVGDTHNGSGPAIATTHHSLVDNVTLGDSPDGNASAAIWGTLAPNDVVYFTGTYTVTQADINTL